MEDSDLNVFSEAQLPVTKADIVKPSKDFIVNLINVFFNTFHIDGYAIKQPTREQLSVLISEDQELYEEVIKLINMNVAMSGIYERIFVKDFQLVDIASPTPKKTMKVMKYLANFVLYYKNKLSEIEESVNYIVDRREIIDQLIHKKKDALEKIATSTAYREGQSNYNEKLRQEIEKVRKGIMKKTSLMDDKKEQVKLLELERQKVIQVHASKQSEALKVNEKTTSLHTQVVESPEQLNSQLRELEKQKDSKIKERELKYESIKEKKQLLERRENIRTFIQKEAGKLLQVLKILNEKKAAVQQLENIIKEQEGIQDVISKLEKNQEIQQNHCSASEIIELNQQIEQRLSPLREQCTQLSKERKKLDAKFKDEQEKQREILLQLDSITEEITILEKGTSDFLKQCQELYRKEISEDMEICQIFEDLIQKESQS